MAACFNQSLLPWVWCLPVFWMKHSVCVCVCYQPQWTNRRHRFCRRRQHCTQAHDTFSLQAMWSTHQSLDHTYNNRNSLHHTCSCSINITMNEWIFILSTQIRYSKNSKKTELCQLDRKAQKSTYNCPKRYVNEEIHYNNTHTIQLQHCNNPSTTQLQASTSHQPIAGNVVRKSVTGSHLQSVNTATIKR